MNIGRASFRRRSAKSGAPRFTLHLLPAKCLFCRWLWTQPHVGTFRKGRELAFFFEPNPSELVPEVFHVEMARKSDSLKKKKNMQGICTENLHGPGTFASPPPHPSRLLTGHARRPRRRRLPSGASIRVSSIRAFGVARPRPLGPRPRPRSLPCVFWGFHGSNLQMNMETNRTII